MKIKSMLFFILAFFLAGMIYATAGPGQNSIPKVETGEGAYTGNFTYIIGPGDVLDIKVWRHQDLDTRAIVRPDGNISFPLVADTYLCDLTIKDAEAKIKSGLSKVIKDPVVTINVSGFQSKKIFVLGEVNRPGVYPFEGRVSVLDALSRASGYKEDTASLKSILVVSRGYTSKPKAFRVNMYNVIVKGEIDQDIYLEPGDIVFVPKTFIANVDTFIDQFFTKTDPALKYYLDIYDVQHPKERFR